MLLNPKELRQNPDRLEEIEKVSLRLVTQAIYDYRITAMGEAYLTTTLFVKYNYEEQDEKSLGSITIASVPNGMLQDRYNPTAQDTIWIAGRNAPTLGEEFRVRLSFHRLKEKANWRVQNIPLPPGEFSWEN